MGGATTAGSAGADAARRAAGSIGVPQTSQKSSVDEVCPCGQTALIGKPPAIVQLSAS